MLYIYQEMLSLMLGSMWQVIALIDVCFVIFSLKRDLNDKSWPGRELDKLES